MIKKIASVLAIGLLAAGIHGSCSAANAAPASLVPIVSPSENTIAPPVIPAKLRTVPKVQAGAVPQAGGRKVAKKAPPAPGAISTFSTCVPATYCYNYAGAEQIVSNIGIAAYMNVKKPYVSTGEGSLAHSLGQVHVNDGLTPGNGIEAGWIVDKSIACTPTPACKDDPKLFTFWTKNGVGQGYNTGFVDYASNPINVGANLASDNDGVADLFKVIYSGGNWWLGYKTDWIGYWPGGNWTSPTFTAGAYYQIFGEVAATDAKPCLDMGTGIQGSPYSGSNGSAKMSGATGQGLPTGITTNLTLMAISPPGYTEAYFTGYTYAFTYGGPGYANGSDTVVGTAGSC